MDDNVEDDDFNLYPGGKSRLSKLFSTQQNDSGDINQSLIYVPPKQPKKSVTPSNANAVQNLRVLHVMPAYAYKLEKRQYTKQGQLGAAILGDPEARVYKLLLYKGKSTSVSMASIDQNFKYLVEPNNYAKFSNDNGEKWSISFKTEDEFIEFARQVALAKVNSLGKLPVIVIMQDLVAGEGSAAEIGDSITFSFTGRLYKNLTYSDVFDTSFAGNKSVVVLGNPSIPKGWNEGLMDAKKNLKRLLFMTVANNSGFAALPDFVTPHDILVFEITVYKVKRPSEKPRSPSMNKNSIDKKPDVPPRTHSVSNEDIRSRGASLSEQLTQSPKKDNADIISRMARIGGTHLLPQTSNNVQTSSESEPEKEVEEKPKPRRYSSVSPKHTVAQKTDESEESNKLLKFEPRLSTSNISLPLTHQGNIYPATSFASGESVHYLHQPYIPHPHVVPSIMPHTIPSPMGSTLSSFDNQLPLLVAETRSQNTELRFGLNKISDKIDNAVLKIDEIRQYQGNRLNHSQVPYMEADMLARNVERIAQENKKLKEEVEVKNSKIQELSENLFDALQGNQKLLKENNSILEQRNENLLSGYQNQIQALEVEKTNLTQQLSEMKSQSETMQVELTNLQEEAKNLQEKLRISEELRLKNEEIVASLTSDKENNGDVVQVLQKTLDVVTKEKNDLSEELRLAKIHVAEAETAAQQLKNQGVNDSEKMTAAFLEMRVLQEKLQTASRYQEQYASLRKNSLLMKEKYEDRIRQLNDQLKTMPSSSSTNFPAELKKTMNALYKKLQNKFDVKSKYPGSEALDICLSVIKETTFAVLSKEQTTDDTSSVKGRAQKERADSTSSQLEGSVDESVPLKPIAEKKDQSISDKNHCKDTKENKDLETGDHVSKQLEENSGNELSSSGDHPVHEANKKMASLVSSSSDSEKDQDQHLKNSKSPEEKTPKIELSAEETPKIELSVEETPKIELSAEETSKVELSAEDTPKIEVSTEITKPDAQEFPKAIESKESVPAGNERIEEANKNETAKAEMSSSLATWRPQPSPPPLFDDDDEEEDEDDWLK